MNFIVSMGYGPEKVRPQFLSLRQHQALRPESRRDRRPSNLRAIYPPFSGLPKPRKFRQRSRSMHDPNTPKLMPPEVKSSLAAGLGFRDRPNPVRLYNAVRDALKVHWAALEERAEEEWTDALAAPRGGAGPTQRLPDGPDSRCSRAQG